MLNVVNYLTTCECCAKKVVLQV